MNVTVTVADHDPAWAERFRELSALFATRLAGLLTAIEHVGSTAVPGLVAKPILDIDLVIASRDRFPAIRDALAALGYTHRGDGGIVGRESFAGSPPAPGVGLAWPAHHLYVCVQGNVALAEHLAFRDRLRGDSALRAAYAALKHDLARTSPNRDSYSDGKTAFIRSALAARSAGGGVP